MTTVLNHVLPVLLHFLSTLCSLSGEI